MSVAIVTGASRGLGEALATGLARAGWSLVVDGRDPVTLDAAQWERLPDRLGIDPEQHAASAGILAEVRRVVEDELTAHQRRVFVAVVVDGIPLDALAARLSLQRNAIYKVIFDARRKIRRALVANGYLEDGGLERR